MSIFHDNILAGASGQQGYKIERSLRFNSADSAYLNRTAGTPTDNKKWTWSAWAKISGASQALNFASSASGTSMYFGLETSQGDNFIMQIAGTRVYKSTAIFRDPSAWYHLVFVFDSANGTQADRSILYVNGVRQAATTASVTLNQTTGFNAASTAMNIGYSNGWTATSSDYFSGYLTEVHFIDGQALTPSSFGETDTITGVWKPKKYSGSYGTNGFYLKFADNSGTTSTTLGKDSSGNGNNWTPNNFSVTAGAGNDSLIDTPTSYADGGNGRGNYCTGNPLYIPSSNSRMSLTNGNLEWGQAATNAVSSMAGTFAMRSGKWYWEVTVGGTVTYSAIGMQTDANTAWRGGGTVLYRSDGQKLIGGTNSAYGASYTTNDVLGFAYDADAGTLTCYKNNTSQGTIYSSGTGNSWIPAIHDDNAGAGVTYYHQLNFGQRAFAYTPPSGFKALNTQNLPEPSIKKPNQWMDATTYTGTGTTQSITNSGSMQPDFVWVKSRSNAYQHWLFDSVRGAGLYLNSNATTAEGNGGSAVLSSFNANGFTYGSDVSGNGSGSTYVAWQWKESATPGFDIVTYTGNGTNRTIAHSLGVAPKMLFIKKRTGTTGYTFSDWVVWHTNIPATNILLLSQTWASTTETTVFNSTAPTSSVFSVGTNTLSNENTGTFVAYLWSEVQGFSKFGSYTGNGSTDGPFVFCGFRPRWIMIKSSTDTGNWNVMDTSRLGYNVNNSVLYPDLTNAEQGYLPADILSNGFKIRLISTGGSFNTSGQTYIFAAFAESPQKYSLAR